MEQTTARTDCPVCGSATIAKVIGEYARCADCRHERIIAPLAESGVMENNRARTAPTRLGPLLRAQVRVARSGYRPGMGLLDFGCGDGRFLYHANRAIAPDAPAYGIEQSEESVRVAVDVHGCTVFPDAAHVPKGEYLVTAWHVIEHLPPYDAADILRGVRERLHEGSRFVVSVPNGDSRQAHLFGAKWGCIEAAHHYSQFSSQSLDKLMQKAGFEPRGDRWIALYGMYGTAQGTANLLVKPHNQAHRWLKRGRDAGTAAHTAASLALAVASTPLTLGFAALEAFQPTRRATVTRVYEAV